VWGKKEGAVSKEAEAEGLGAAAGVWFDTPFRKTPGRLTTNGGELEVGCPEEAG